MLKYTIETISPEMTQKVGFYLGKCLRSGDCISLSGSIGSGKTCLIQGIAHGLGVPDNIHVTSPSYTLINRYPGNVNVYHVDLYRLENETDLNGFEIDEVLTDDGVVLIEWPKLVMTRFHSFTFRIFLYWDMADEYHRRLEFYDDSNRFNAFFEKLNDAFPGY